MNTLEFNIDSYYDIDLARNALYNDVIDILEILIRNGYIATIRETRDGLIVLEYEYDNHLFNNASDTENPYWITKSEYNIIQTRRDNAEKFSLRLP